jgi:hypothetical protein
VNATGDGRRKVCPSLEEDLTAEEVVESETFVREKTAIPVQEGQKREETY